MKVSKPVIIFGIVVLLLAGYIHFFTGKKKSAVRVVPATNQSQPAQQGQAQQAPQTAAKAIVPPAVTEMGRQHAADNGAKPDFDKAKGAWVKNPFALPQLKEEKRKETSTAVRLVGIFEKGKDRLAIIDHEVVRKGDMVGDEKIVEIEKDKVVLVRNNARRTILLMPAENIIREEGAKMTITEKGK